MAGGGEGVREKRVRIWICGKALGGQYLKTCASLLSTWQDQVLLPGISEDEYSCFVFFCVSFFPKATPSRWSSLYKPCVQPFVSAQLQLSSSCHKGKVQYLWFSDCLVILKLEIKTKMLHKKWLWSALTYQKLEEPSLKRPSATHTQSSSWPSSSTLWWQTQWRHNSFWD